MDSRKNPGTTAQMRVLWWTTPTGMLLGRRTTGSNTHQADRALEVI
jgi:hypothetical protein